MSHFSVKEAISFSFSTYRKHFVLLAIASAIIAGALGVCSTSLERIARQSGILYALDTAAIAKKQGHSSTLQSITAESFERLKRVPIHFYISFLIIFIVGYAFFFFLMLGYLHICLTLRDTGHASLKLLFASSWLQVKRFVGAAVLYGMSAMGGCLGVVTFTVLASMMGRFFLSGKSIALITPMVCIGLMIAVMVWLMGYMFFGFCILDKPQTGSLEALRMSAMLSQGYRPRILKTLLGMFLIVIVPLVVLLAVMVGVGKMLSVGDQRMAVFIQFISIIVTYPLFGLCSSYLYRSLTGIK
jgi:hypothetical protein